MKDVLKLTLDTQCVIYLFDVGVDKPPHFDSLQELLNLSFSGKLVIAITTRVELDLGRDPVPVRRATLFEKLGIFPVVGTSPLLIQSVEGEPVAAKTTPGYGLNYGGSSFRVYGGKIGDSPTKRQISVI